MSKFVLAVVLAATFFACSKPLDNNQEVIAKETPKVLQEDANKDLKILSSRYGSDIFDDLYEELSQKEPDLTKINLAIASLKATYMDSLELFDKYKSKSLSYYSSAELKIQDMQDSTLRMQMMKLIKNSAQNFSDKISRLESLESDISSKFNSISDHYTMVKVLRTLSLIEKYQNDYLVNNASLLNVIKQQNKIISELKRLAK